MMQKVDLQKQRKKKKRETCKAKKFIFCSVLQFYAITYCTKNGFFCQKKKRNTLPISEPLKKTKLTRKICIFLGFCKIVGILYLEVKKSVRTANV